jgi:polyisoprenoid-binding protein YceI
MKSTLAALVVAGTTLAAPGEWRVGESAVRVICPMTVGGSFDVKTAALSGSVTASPSGSSAFDGSLAVDLRTLETGIDLRNEHLRTTYLEVARGPDYQTATVSAIDLKGLNRDAPDGKGSFTGSLTLHGTTKAVSGAVDVRRAGAGLQVKASFPVNLSDFGIREPRYLGVGVKNTVQVQVTFAVTH